MPDALPSASCNGPRRPSYQACLGASDGVTAAMNDGIGTEFDYQDARLNKVYGALRAALDPAQKSALRREELKWIASRDAACAPAKDVGTAARLDGNACRVDRTAELERMLGAHAAGGGTDGQ
ncbi:DUF1311 domain-containing protein [Azospirillum sp. YIM B02556]|uniref:DUF1311 domain-containing protein n=1 Tax=Azospirillum endophyticum TaxID=2800326 RepID=A0ABS1FB47_9PROT|nr:lysozyme inhibitor LprI family protein [Azospirillum endophyticum]MBK1840653.1 DUF1311 domain-containing protein [Azospirillum endophyticum]